MPTSRLLFSTGDQLDVEGSVDQVVKEIENAARSSSGTLARLTLSDTGESIAISGAHVVAIRAGRQETSSDADA